MTNPIMPGIEKLAEKYGIDVSKKSKIITKPKLKFLTNDFKIEVYDNDFFINNVRSNIVNEKFCNENLIVTFGMLDNWKRHNLHEWLVEKDFRNMKDTAITYDIPNSQTIFNILNTLRKNKESNYKNEIELVKQHVKFIFNREIITGTTLHFNAGLKTKINHYNPKTNDHEYQLDFPNSDIEIENGLGLEEITKYLTGLTIDDLNKTSEWLIDKKTCLYINTFVKPKHCVVTTYFSDNYLVINCNQIINNEFSSLGVKEI